MQPLAALLPSRRIVLPALPAGSAAVVATAGTAAGASCLPVAGGRILLRNQPLVPHVGACSAVAATA